MAGEIFLSPLTGLGGPGGRFSCGLGCDKNYNVAQIGEALELVETIGFVLFASFATLRFCVKCFYSFGD
jgi:hypothetical protein